MRNLLIGAFTAIVFVLGGVQLGSSTPADYGNFNPDARINVNRVVYADKGEEVK